MARRMGGLLLGIRTLDSHCDVTEKMTRPPITTLRRYLPPPADLSRLTDGELAAHCEAMGHRLRDSGLDNTCRLLMEAAERLGRNG